MSNMNYTELFYSIQGEGYHIGVPSIFLRMFGCNFRCKNFNRYEKDILGNDEKNPEVLQIIKDLDRYKTFDELPLVSTGCDSYTSIYPEFKKFVIKETSDQLVPKILDLLPNKQWKNEHLIITGGEPLLGWQKSYPDVLDHPDMQFLKSITFETNGTQLLKPDFQHYLEDWQWFDNTRQITFSVSPKLSCSGEKREDTIKPDVILQYQKYGLTYLKLVVGTKEDVDEALEVIKIYQNAGFYGHVYLMAVGGTPQSFNLNNKTVAELAMKHGLRYSDRLQVSLFGNEWAT
jgi:7-carboxy-7-deazaguanine synthase